MIDRLRLGCHATGQSSLGTPTGPEDLALGVPLAAGVLYPGFGLLLSPMIAALTMSLSSVSVITNALRLAKTPLPQNPSQDRRPEPANGASFH